VKKKERERHTETKGHWTGDSGVTKIRLSESETEREGERDKERERRREREREESTIPFAQVLDEAVARRVHGPLHHLE
jgi:hypothetical protein